MTPYHYTESGLDNVYLYNIPMVVDAGGEKVVYIPKINLLHKTIAQGIINKKGLLTGKEIKFLRKEIGYMQSQFSELMGKEAQACGRWERGEHPIDKTIDTLIRIIISKELDLHLDYSVIPSLNTLSAANDNINIDGTDNNYALMDAA